MDNVGSAINGAVKAAEPALFAVGFVMGATEDLSYSGTQPATFIQRVSDAIARATGVKLNLGGGSSASTQNFKLNWTGWLNKGLGAAAAAWIYKEAKLPYAADIYRLVFPLGVGYSIGGVFDDPPGVPGGGGAAGSLGYEPNYPGVARSSTFYSSGTVQPKSEPYTSPYVVLGAQI